MESPASITFPALTGCRPVDCYERLNKIDEGTYGVVYRARDIETGEIVALKRIKMDKFTEGFPITALREILTLIRHTHPNIVQVKEVVVGKKLSSVFLVMEFVEHELRSLLDDMVTPFSPAEVKCLMLQLLKGLAHLHDQWIMHRDLKASNILLNNKGILKIADFGLARTYGTPLKKYTQPVVTLCYRAPELLLGEKIYTPAIDMWSVGCIFGELLTGKILLSGQGELDQLKKIMNLLGAPTEDIWPGVSALPESKRINMAPRNPRFKERFKRFSPATVDLLICMLTYDPSKRITAKEALSHPYFVSESPPPQDPSMMPTFPSRAEGQSRKKNLEELMEGKLTQAGGLLSTSDAHSTFSLRL